MQHVFVSRGPHIVSFLFGICKDLPTPKKTYPFKLLASTNMATLWSTPNQNNIESPNWNLCIRSVLYEVFLRLKQIESYLLILFKGPIQSIYFFFICNKKPFRYHHHFLVYYYFQLNIGSNFLSLRITLSKQHLATSFC